MDEILKTITSKIDPALYFSLFPNWLFINAIHQGSARFILYSEEIIIQSQSDLSLLNYEELLLQTPVHLPLKSTTFPSSVSTSRLSVPTGWTRNLYVWLLLACIILTLSNTRTHTCLKQTLQTSDLSLGTFCHPVEMIVAPPGDYFCWTILRIPMVMVKVQRDGKRRLR